jgi:hypothetical protein
MTLQKSWGAPAEREQQRSHSSSRRELEHERCTDADKPEGVWPRLSPRAHPSRSTSWGRGDRSKLTPAVLSRLQL